MLKHDKARLAKWRTAMALDFMSSEESTSEHDSDGDTEECFTIRKVTWRSEKVDKTSSRINSVLLLLTVKNRRCALSVLKVNLHLDLLCVATRTVYGCSTKMPFLLHSKLLLMKCMVVSELKIYIVTSCHNIPVAPHNIQE